MLKSKTKTTQAQLQGATESLSDGESLGAEDTSNFITIRVFTKMGVQRIETNKVLLFILNLR